MDFASFLDAFKRGLNNRYVKWIVKLGATALAIWIVSTSIEFSELWAKMKTANLLYIFFAFVLMVLSKFLSIARISVFYEAHEIRMDYKTNFKLFFIGLFYNMILPGGFGGDGYKVVWLRANGFSEKVKNALRATLLDRLNGMIGLMLITCGVVYLSSLMAIDEISYVIYASPIVAILGTLLCFRVFTNTVIVQLKTLPYSLLIQGLSVLALCLNAYAIAGIDWIEYTAGFSLSTFTFLVPLFIGGVGSREVFLTFMEPLLDIQLNVVLAAIMFNHAQRLAMALVGLPYILKQKKVL
ncbi:MAG: lysylphosphatidylglycerol synthase transmembrane domain-containing protein [Cryomorphaceae bacterium]